MKTQTRNRWLLLAALCAAGTAFAGQSPTVAEAPEAGSAIDILAVIQRTVEAHEHLGPAIIHGSLVETASNFMVAGTQVFKGTVVVRRNDGRHFVARVVGPQWWDDHVYLISGQDGIGTDLSGANALRITDQTNMTISNVINLVPFEDLVTDLRHALKTVSGRKALQSAQVTEILASGNPAYRMLWKISPVPRMSDLDLVIGKRDGLIGQVTTTLRATSEMKALYAKLDVTQKEQMLRAGAPTVPPEFSTVWKATFTRQPKPFPASTFILPKGKRPRKLWM